MRWKKFRSLREKISEEPRISRQEEIVISATWFPSRQDLLRAKRSVSTAPTEALPQLRRAYLTLSVQTLMWSTTSRTASTSTATVDPRISEIFRNSWRKKAWMSDLHTMVTQTAAWRWMRTEMLWTATWSSTSVESTWRNRDFYATTRLSRRSCQTSVSTKRWTARVSAMRRQRSVTSMCMRTCQRPETVSAVSSPDTSFSASMRRPVTVS